MELGVLINGLADSIGANRGIATILDNPIYTALICTLIIMIIYYFATVDGKSCATTRLRTSFYIFCALLLVMFVYHRRFQKCQMTQSKVSEIQSALANPPTIPSAERVPIIQPVYLTGPPRPTPFGMT